MNSAITRGPAIGTRRGIGTPRSFLPSPAGRWILGTYTEKAKSEGGKTYRSRYEFDGHGGLVCERRQLGNGLHGSDLMRKLVRGSDGRVRQEIRAGGDGGSSGGGLCPTAGSRVHHGFCLPERGGESADPGRPVAVPGGDRPQQRLAEHGLRCFGPGDGFELGRVGAFRGAPHRIRLFARRGPRWSTCTPTLRRRTWW